MRSEFTKDPVNDFIKNFNRFKTKQILKTRDLLENKIIDTNEKEEKKEKEDLLNYLSDAINSIYESRKSFMESAQSVTNITILIYSAIFGLIVFISKEKDNINFLMLNFTTLQASFFVYIVNYKWLYELNREKLISAYNLYASSTIHANFISKAMGVETSCHLWLNILDSMDKNLSLCLKNGFRFEATSNLEFRQMGISFPVESYDIVKMKDPSLYDYKLEKMLQNTDDFNKILLSLFRFPKNSIFHYYSELLSLISIKFPKALWLISLIIYFVINSSKIHSEAFECSINLDKFFHNNCLFLTAIVILETGYIIYCQIIRD